ncbi:MAG TPA: hypothetical protein VF945_12130, partial [Polyangia bacterium]
SQRGFHRQHWSAIFAGANFDLYEGNGERAWSALHDCWRRLQRSLLLRSQPVRVAALFVRGRAAVATGRRHHARRCAGRLAREGVGWATGLSALLDASIDPSPAAFEAAARLLAAADLSMHAAVARRCAGRDDPWWRDQAIVNPDGFVRCFAPGARRG